MTPVEFGVGGAISSYRRRSWIKCINFIKIRSHVFGTSLAVPLDEKRGKR
jgi:hypothetical protein